MAVTGGGLAGTQLTDPATLAPAHTSIAVRCAGLMAAGGLLALAAVPASMAAVRPPTSSAAT
jgi:ABC-type Co2+ transport system permease subunit